MNKKKDFFNRLSLLAIATVTFIGSVYVNPIETRAEEYWPTGPNVSSKSAVVMEVNTGTVLYEKKAHDQHYPASITKILTTYLAIENSNLNDIVTFSEKAVYDNEGDTSHIWRDVGEEMTMEQTLYAVMLASANECAYASAEYVGKALGGDYRTFIDLMNEKAKALGCKDTHFNNANGLPDEKHYTSAYDMALISCAAYKNEDFRIITGAKTYTIPPTNKHSEPTYLSNHHNVLHYYNTSKYVNQYCTGGKTGYTTVANSTLVTYAEKDGMTICVVVMDAKSPDHYKDTNTLIDYCFGNYQTYNIAENETSIQDNTKKSYGVLNNNESFVTLDETAYIILPNTVEFSEAKFDRDESPEDNSVVALKYSYAGREVGSVEIVTTGASVDLGYFNNEVQDANGKIVKIKPLFIILVLVLLIGLIVAIYYLKRLYDNFYVIKHRIEDKREQKARFKEVKKRNKRPRRKDRMFK